jgi:iron-sulfur cluster assembly accessory protein
MNRIRKLNKLRAPDEHHLRISVDSGGCSGFSYVFDVESVEERDDEDVVVKEGDVEVVVDEISLWFISKKAPC